MSTAHSSKMTSKRILRSTTHPDRASHDTSLGPTQPTNVNSDEAFSDDGKSPVRHADIKQKRRRAEQVQAPSKRSRPNVSGSQPESPTTVPLETNRSMGSPDSRPAEPHATNAPLVTPRGSRLVAYPRDVQNASPLKVGLPRSTTSTAHILEDACAHLRKTDARLTPLIDKHYCSLFSPTGLAEECDPFRSLSSGIISQQVSGAAASAIKKKFVNLFEEPSAQSDSLEFPTPQQVAACSIPFLREAGLSERKAEYIKGLAEKFANGELSASLLLQASDEEIFERLTAVRGLGRWSVEVRLFALYNVFKSQQVSQSKRCSLKQSTLRLVIEPKFRLPN